MGRLASLLALLCLSLACKHINPADKEAQVDSYENVTKLPAIVCQNGELMSFHLEEQGLEPKASEIKFTTGSIEEDYTLLKPSRDLNVRLDLCVSAKETLQLRRVVYLTRPDQPALTITPNRFSQVRGLEAAIFQDEHAEVWVEMRYGPQEEGYLMRGWKKGKESFVTFSAIRRHAEGSVVPKDGRLLIGKLIYGNPWQ